MLSKAKLYEQYYIKLKLKGRSHESVAAARDTRKKNKRFHHS